MTFLLALLLFLTSGTAVVLFDYRLSDLSLVALLSVMILKVSILDKSLSFITSGKSAIIIIAILIILSVLLSSARQFYYAPFHFDDEVRNTFAIIISLLLAILFLMSGLNAHNILNISKHFSRILVSICISLYIYQLLLGVPSWIDELVVDERYSALSINPNQLALFLLPVPFFSIICLMAGIIRKQEMLIIVFLSALLNILIIGKALFVAWIISLVYLVISGSIVLVKSEIKFVNSVTKFLFVLTTCMILISLSFLLFIGDFSGSQLGQGSLRIDLWLNGLDAWFDSFIFGHGSGHYSGINEPYQSMESHNFFIDWATAYGYFGLIILVSFFISIIYFVVRDFNHVLIALIISIFIQLTFHFYGRHPIFWVVWVFIYIIAEDRYKTINKK